MSEPAGSADRRRIRFVNAVAQDDVVLLRFADPAPRYAVAARGEVAGDAASEMLDVVLLPISEAAPDFSAWLGETSDADAPAAVYVKYRGVESMWRRVSALQSRAVLQCEAEQADALLAALAEFAHYEGELRRIEAEIAGSWGELEEDNTLAFDVNPADLRRSDAVGARMERTLRRRMRLARVEAHLYTPDAKLTAAAQKLGEALRERAEIEARAEIADGQIEVFEHIYEMGAQRMGEYRAARQGHIVEWIIVALLAAELLLLGVQAFR